MIVNMLIVNFLLCAAHRQKNTWLKIQVLIILSSFFAIVSNASSHKSGWKSARMLHWQALPRQQMRQ